MVKWRDKIKCQGKTRREVREGEEEEEDEEGDKGK